MTYSEKDIENIKERRIEWKFKIEKEKKIMK
jgi:hypothetical protein